MFMGKRPSYDDDIANGQLQDYFSQKRGHYFVGKRRNQLFLGKREFENDEEPAQNTQSIDDLVQELLNKRGGRKFIG